MLIKPVIKGFIGTAALLAVYFPVVSLISGWPFALSQFSRFWYFIMGLAAGFGIQIGLYAYLKNAIHQNAPKGVVAISGTTSNVAMISCCAHYLTNILPVIGVAGAVSLIGQYQVELFWVGLVANIIGITYIANKIRKFLNPRSIMLTPVSSNVCIITTELYSLPLSEWNICGLPRCAIAWKYACSTRAALWRVITFQPTISRE